MKREISTVVINRIKYAIFLSIYLGGFLFTSILISINLKTIIPFFICAGVPIIILLIFEKKVREYFTKKASIFLFDDKLIIKLFDRKTDALQNEEEFNYSKIKSFRAKDSGAFQNVAV
ncbi:MAG TPA: hypothetical protein VNG53_11485 [Bacteroidia bacterium]|nr:hypothetical protein [Bacteroidia bacterium]